MKPFRTKMLSVEINPLVLCDGQVVALDSKITIDDNALFRRKDTLELRDLDEEDPAETEASENDLITFDWTALLDAWSMVPVLLWVQWTSLRLVGVNQPIFLMWGEYPGKS